MSNSVAGVLSQPVYAFDNPTIKDQVPRNKAGVYLLSKLVDGIICPQYVGRSDSCLLRRLTKHPHKHLGFFQFVKCDSAYQAYLLERLLFWRLRPPLNIAFPNQPKYSDAAPVELRALQCYQNQIQTLVFASKP